MGFYSLDISKLKQKTINYLKCIHKLETGFILQQYLGYNIITTNVYIYIYTHIHILEIN